MQVTRQTRIILCVGTLFAASLIAFSCLSENQNVRRLLDNIHWTFGNLLTATAAYIAYRQHGKKPRDIRKNFFLGALVYVLGDLGWNVQALIHWEPFPSPSHLLFLGSCLFWIVGYWRQLIGGLASTQRIAAGLDGIGLVVATVAVTLALYLPYRDHITVPALITYCAYPVAWFAAAILSLLVAVYRRPNFHWSWAVLTGMLAVYGILWTTWNERTLDHTLVDGGLFNGMFTIVKVTMAWAIAFWTFEEPEHVQGRTPQISLPQFVPMIAGIAAAGALAFAFTLPSLPPVIRWCIELSSLLIIILCVVRQSLMVKMLHDNEIRNALIMQGASDGIWDWSIPSKHIYYSDRVKETLGYSGENVGKSIESFYEHIHPNDIEHVKQAVDAHLRRKTPYRVEFRLRTMSGGYRWFLSSGQATWDQKGNPIRACGTLTDIHARKVAEEALRSLSELQGAILESAGFAIVTADTNGITTLFNHAAETMLGYRASEVVGRKSVLTWHDDQQLRERSAEAPGGPVSPIDALYARSRTGERDDREWIMVRKDGSRFPAILSIAALKNHEGNVSGFLGLIADISERKSFENEILRLNTELEARIDAKTADLVAMNAELESFAYSVSHDLRSPLRGLDGFSRLLDERLEELNMVEERKHVARVRSGVKRMAEIIDSLLLLSRVSRSALKTEATNLSELVQQLAEELGAAQSERKIEWRIGESHPIHCDRNLMRLMLQNILENSLKYSRTRDHTTIEFSEISYGEDWAEYIIKDNGVGFDETYAGQMFKPFQRLHGPNEYEGTGIGLATVQRIINRHRGTVRATGKVEVGTTIIFSLPARPETYSSAKTSQGPQINFR